MTSGAPRWVGVVLAGGRSTRWGSEKAVATVEGEPMVARVAAVLARGCEVVAVNAPDASGAAAWAREHDLPVLPDPPGAPDGPLVGVLEGLEWAAAAGADALVTAPCDTPHLPPDYVAELVEALASAPAAFASTVDGPQPLCAAWSVALIPALGRALRSGHPSARRWLEDNGACERRFAEAHAFRNLNTAPDERAGPLG